VGNWTCALEDVVLKRAHINYGKVDPTFWKGRRVFLTGHTGFKGGWLSLWLTSMGAKVTGYSLAPNTSLNFFTITNLEKDLVKSHIADIRDLVTLQYAISIAKPEVVIHMAAQPLVRHSYLKPVETYATNVMGTVHILESIRSVSDVRAVVIVSSDKCYENQEWVWGYRENEPMGGHDPYSNSKGCTELVTSAYRRSYFPEDQYSKHQVAIASARAGNVIGGGDWSEDRLIPDAIKAFNSNQQLRIRNPLSIRPWQHVLEPLSGYLMLAQALHEKGAKFNGGWNFGPSDDGTRSVADVIDLLIDRWPTKATWIQDRIEQPHEARSLKLDCSKAYQYLNWSPSWSLETAINMIADWSNAHRAKADMRAISTEQINNYINS